MRAIILATLVACGPSGARPEGDAGGTEGDAGVQPAGNVDCNQRHTRTVVLADGSKYEQLNIYALVDVDPNDDWRLEMCGVTTEVFPTPTAGGCPAGATCSETGTPQPPYECSWNAGNGAFTADAKLIVNCGNGFTQWNAQGQMISSTQTRYSTIRIHR
jgi:hypothetical protein